MHELLHRLTDATGRQTQTPRRQLLGVLHGGLLWRGLLLHLWAWTRQLRQTHLIVRRDLSKGDIIKKMIIIKVPHFYVPSLQHQTVLNYGLFFLLSEHSENLAAPSLLPEWKCVPDTNEELCHS